MSCLVQLMTIKEEYIYVYTHNKNYYSCWSCDF